MWTPLGEGEHSRQRVIYRQPWLAALHLSPFFSLEQIPFLDTFLPALLPCDCPCKWSLEGRLYAQNICANWPENSRGQNHSVCYFHQAVDASPMPAPVCRTQAAPIVHPQPFLWASTCSAEAPWCLSHGETLLGVDSPCFTHLGVDPSCLTHQQQQHDLSTRGTSGLQWWAKDSALFLLQIFPATKGAAVSLYVRCDSQSKPQH